MGADPVAIPYLRLTPVKKAGSPTGNAAGRAAHHAGTRVSHGAAGKAAYLSGERIRGSDGLVTDYRDKFGVEHAELVLPGGGTCDRERLWNAIDAHKTQRPTADVAYDFIVAFPSELSFAERKEAARGLALWIANRYQIAVDYGMHLPETGKGTDERNFHGHYLISARKVSATGELGLIQRELNQRVCQRIDPKRGRTERQPTAVTEIRTAWERIANDTLARGGHQARISMRSYKAQGIDRQPGKHRGAAENQRLREVERLRAAERAGAGERRQANAGPTERSAVAAKGAPIGRTIGELRAELAEAGREMMMRSKTARDRIDAIQEQRKPAPMGPAITADIGSVQGWMHDPASQFVRAWEAADRASALRRRVRAVQRARAALRAPTKEEAAELRSAERARTRADKLCARIAKVLDQTKRLDPTERITAPDAARSSRQLDAIERTLAGHARRTQQQHAAMEM